MTNCLFIKETPSGKIHNVSLNDKHIVIRNLVYYRSHRKIIQFQHINSITFSIWSKIHKNIWVQYATMEQATESIVRQARREIKKNIMRRYHQVVFENKLPKFRDDYKSCQNVFTLCENVFIKALFYFSLMSFFQ